MAFKLTYRDGEADDYGDDTAWTVEDGVLKMGREDGNWTVLVSPSHWATIEVGDDRKDSDKDDDDKKKKDKNDDDKKKQDKDEDDDDDSSKKTDDEDSDDSDSKKKADEDGE